MSIIGWQAASGVWVLTMLMLIGAAFVSNERPPSVINMVLFSTMMFIIARVAWFAVKGT